MIQVRLTNRLYDIIKYTTIVCSMLLIIIIPALCCVLLSPIIYAQHYAGIVRQALLSRKRGQTGDCFTLSEKMARREKWSEMPPTIPIWGEHWRFTCLWVHTYVATFSAKIKKVGLVTVATQPKNTKFGVSV